MPATYRLIWLASLTSSVQFSPRLSVSDPRGSKNKRSLLMSTIRVSLISRFSPGFTVILAGSYRLPKPPAHLE
jgi:hypothetical protein